MIKIEAFIFDLDGIIADTTHFHYLSWKMLAGSFGYSFREEDNERLKGANRMTSLNIILDLAGLPFPEKEREVLCARKNEIYLDLIKEMNVSDTLPGVIRFIEMARRQGLKTGLASSSKNAKATIRMLHLGDLFDAQLDGNDVARGKPFPDVYHQIARLLGIPPAGCLVFEDAANGIEAARKAGMWVLGMGHPDQIAGADLIIDTFENQTPSGIIDQLARRRLDHTGKPENRIC
jgi:beta-phosphoglucomutase